MKIPSKTFLFGEYLALLGGPSIILCSEPSFTVEYNDGSELSGIHPESPAGRYYTANKIKKSLKFGDPHNGLGGFGASSAQFLAVYSLHHPEFNIFQPKERLALLTAYQQYATLPGSSTPSGVDLIAQAVGSGIVIYDGEDNKLEHIDWPFAANSLVLERTGHKIATHEHLINLDINKIPVKQLREIVLAAIDTLKTKDLLNFAYQLEAYGICLAAHGLLDPRTQALLTEFKSRHNLKAAKGCGALGADVMVGIRL